MGDPKPNYKVFEISPWTTTDSKITWDTTATSSGSWTHDELYEAAKKLLDTGIVTPKGKIVYEEDFDEEDYLDENGDCNCPDCQNANYAAMGGNVKEELSFVMYKPDAFERGLVGELMKMVDDKGMRLVAAKTLVMTEDQVAKHYNHHYGKSFWPQMVEFYTSGPTMACVYKGPNANNAIRQLIGSKHPTDSPPGSIRGKYAMSFPKNLIHGSDTAGDAAHEMQHFFTATEIKKLKTS